MMITLNLATLLMLRGTLIAVIRALDAALLEGYGWTPRCNASLDKIVYTKD